MDMTPASIKRGMENEKVSLADLVVGFVLAAALAAGCGGKPQESQKEEAKEEDKLQIGLSFDSFVIERWLRDRDMFVSTAPEPWAAEVNAGSRRR